MSKSEPPPAPPKAMYGSYKYKLLALDGVTILAKSPSPVAALQTASAMYGPLTVREYTDGSWALFNSDGKLAARVSK